MKRTLVTVLLLMAIAVAACAHQPGGGSSTDPYSADSGTQGQQPAAATATLAPPTATAVRSEVERPTATAAAQTPAPDATLPAWMTTPLRDVHTGEVFTVAELTAQGKPVLFELMAVW